MTYFVSLVLSNILISCLFFAIVSSSCLDVKNTDISPCVCLGNQIKCVGQLNGDKLKSIFSNLNKLPRHLQTFEGFDLYQSNVSNINPEIFGNIVFTGFVKLNANKLVNLSFTNFPDLFHLDLSGNQIKSITSKTFTGLKNLRYLSLAGNEITVFPKDAFSLLDNLERIDLSNNKINVVYYDTFSSEYHNNIELNEVNLSSNNLTRLPENIFWPLRRPKLIDLSNNRITNLSGSVLSFNEDVWVGDVVKVSLSSNDLDESDFHSNSFEKILAKKVPVQLDLSNNKFKFLNQSLFSPLFKSHKSSSIILDNNPFECANCANKWIVTDGQLNKTKPIQLSSCSDNKNKTLWENDFKNC